MKFWILWVFDALVALIFVYFFLVGLMDGTVSSFNIVEWLGILGFFATALILPIWLRRSGQSAFAFAVLIVPAIPSVLGLLLLIYVLIAQPRWN